MKKKKIPWLLNSIQGYYFEVTWNEIRKLKIELINPFTPTSDQDKISRYNINIISSR